MHEKKKTAVPRLRFPEFRDAGPWEVKRLGDVAEIITGNTPSTSEPRNYGGERMFVSPADISDERYVENTKTTLSDVGFSTSRRIPPNSVLFVCIGSTIGKVAQNKLECATNQQINSLIALNGFSNDFLYYVLDFNSKKIAGVAGHQAVPIISKSLFSSAKVLIPSLSEQQKIADCLSSLDELIRAESARLESLQAHKKGLMQQIFPAPGETTPRLRFPEFRNAGPWEVNRLGDVADCYQPETISVSSTSEDGKYPIYGANGIIGYFDRYNHEDPEVIVGCRGQCGNVFLTPPKSWITGNSMVIHTKRDRVSSKKFLSYSLTSSDLSYLITGSAQPQITGEIKRHRVSLPSPQEQQKIADCLSSLDDLIRAQGERIEALKQHKKGLMQQLFPQEVD